MQDGFTMLKKATANDFDCLPPALWRLYFKLLQAARFGGGARGCLGFTEDPWSLRDIAEYVNLPPAQCHRDMKRLAAFGMLKWDETFGDGIWWLPHYDHFVRRTGED